MLKCKCCDKSDFGVNMVRTTKDPVRFLDGAIDTVLGEQEVIEKIEYCFCNVCGKVITEEDLYENYTCPICERDVDTLVGGKCVSCDNAINEMESISMDELKMLFIRQQHYINQITGEKKEAKKNIKKAKEKVIEKKEIPSDIEVENDEDDDILSKIENIEADDIDFDDEMEMD